MEKASSVQYVIVAIMVVLSSYVLESIYSMSNAWASTGYHMHILVRYVARVTRLVQIFSRIGVSIPKILAVSN